MNKAPGLPLTIGLMVKEYARAVEVLAGSGVDLVLVSDLSRGIGVSETVEY